ncbi:MAG TPA: universal stress protein [Gammaproteobacteria bacterium]|nr:universal stress protein [Gammaproteobacteria bacterium]
MSEYGNIVVAADFSGEAPAVVRKGVALAKCFDAGIRLLHVIDYFPEDVPVDLIAPENEDPARFLMERAREQLRQLAIDAGCDTAATEVVFSSRSVAHEVVDYAGREGADLLVIGSHGRHGLSEILGATATGIAHRARCDLLVVRAGK